MFRIKMDEAPIEVLENELNKFGERTFPHAVRDYLNITAFEASKEAKETANMVFTMRNQYTTRSIRYERAMGLNIQAMKSAVGSVQEYMREQEEGFTRRGQGKHGVAIPTSYSAGQDGSIPRTKMIKRKFWLSRLKVSEDIREKYSNTKQSVLRRVQEAVESNTRIIFLGIRGVKNYRYKKGFYRVVGGRKVKRGWPTGAKLRLLYEVERSSVRTDPHKWLEPTVAIIMKRQDEYYRRALIRQIERQRQFRSRR